MAKEAKSITITTELKRFKKKSTVVSGIQDSNIDVRQLMKKMKSKLACGGTYKNGRIELQGQHKEAVKSILIKEGFSEEMIEIK